MASKARNIADLLNTSGKITADDLDIGQIGGRKNLIINGGFDVWQRGTSFDLTASAYHADRWRGRDATISRSTDVPANEGFKYSVFYDNDGVRSSINMRQIIEDGKRYTDNKEITLSFWIKGSIASNDCYVDFGDQQHTFFSLTTEWNRVVITVPAYVRNTGNLFVGGLYVDFNFGTDYPDVYITGVQLELGSVATPFEHRSYGEELALCQRYFYNETKTLILNARNTVTDIISGNYHYPVTMRATPTVAVGSLVYVTSFGLYFTDKSGFSCEGTRTSTYNGRFVGYSADAEL